MATDANREATAALLALLAREAPRASDLRAGLRGLLHLLGAQAGLVALPGEGKRPRRVLLAAGPARARGPVKATLRAAAERARHESRLVRESAATRAPRHLLAVPLIDDAGEAQGAIALLRHGGRPFSPADGTLLGSFALVLTRVAGGSAAASLARAERLQHVAHHDALTGLPNRALLLDRLASALARARWNKRTVAVLSLDLDRFKVVNDTLGHDAGDRLLQAVAARLTACVRDGDTVARLGSDELALVLEDMAQLDHVSPVARKILDAFARPFTIDGRELYVTTSIGISLYPTDGEDAQTLAKQADIALHRAKESGGNRFQFYSRQMGAMASERLMLETDLRRALERREFLLHYQPQVNLRTGQVVGAEALLRWPHPEFGMIPPPRFIGLAEETGLIVPLGEWVLQSACEQARRWHADGLPVRLAVNLSARQVVHGQLAETVARVLADTRLPPAFLELELTESTLLHQTAPALDALDELRALGTRILIDDFGTGYSSLAYLKRFPIDALKIDRSFVRDVTADADDAAIVTAITHMAHSLGLLVIAEGVETRQQLDFLRARDCDAFQGYYLSRPVPAERFASLMRVFGIPARA